MSTLSRMPLAQKFLVIGVLAALLAAVPSLLWLRSAWATLARTEQQHAALAPALAGVKTATLAAAHRGLTLAAKAGDEAARSRRDDAARALLAQQASALAALARTGDAELRRRGDELWQQRRALVDEAAGSAPAADLLARHGALIDAELALVADVAERSSLARYPGVAGFHLQQAALQQLPQLAERVGRVRATGMLMLVQGQADAAAQARAAVLLDQIQADAQAATRALALAQAAEPALAATLQQPVRDARAALDAALTLARHTLTEIGSAGSSSTAAEAWWQVTTQAAQAQSALGSAAVTALAARLDAERSAQWRAVLLAGAVLLGVAGFAAALGRRIAVATTCSIRDAIGRADAVAAGDLGGEHGPADAAAGVGGDEGGQLRAALARMTTQLRRLVGGVRDNAVQVASASAQIAQGNLDLSARTEAQASALQQTAASMEELRTTIAASADAAREAATLAQGAREVTDAGGRSVDGLVAAMEQINAGAQRMQDIVATIDSLAFQTNILALNAAVEAARAGEQGRGFAVVASEVRALAQRSSAAAREVRDLIAASQARVEDGVGHGRQVRTTMGEVVASIGRVSGLIAEVSTAAQEQARGVAQVGEAVAEMDRVTQQNAALVEESAAAAQSLHEQAQALQGAVSVFRT